MFSSSVESSKRVGYALFWRNHLKQPNGTVTDKLHAERLILVDVYELGNAIFISTCVTNNFIRFVQRLKTIIQTIGCDSQCLGKASIASGNPYFIVSDGTARQDAFNKQFSFFSDT